MYRPDGASDDPDMDSADSVGPEGGAGPAVGGGGGHDSAIDKVTTGSGGGGV